MHKKISFLLILFISLFIGINTFEAKTKELTCVYTSSDDSSVTLNFYTDYTPDATYTKWIGKSISGTKNIANYNTWYNKGRNWDRFIWEEYSCPGAIYASRNGSTNYDVYLCNNASSCSHNYDKDTAISNAMILPLASNGTTKHQSSAHNPKEVISSSQKNNHGIKTTVGGIHLAKVDSSNLTKKGLNDSVTSTINANGVTNGSLYIKIMIKYYLE